MQIEMFLQFEFEKKNMWLNGTDKNWCSHIDRWIKKSG